MAIDKHQQQCARSEARCAAIGRASRSRVHALYLFGMIAAAFAMLVSWAGDAAAGDFDPFTSLVDGGDAPRAKRAAAAGPAEYLVAGRKGGRFEFEAQGAGALIRFLCADTTAPTVECALAGAGGAGEILHLSAVQGARGDTLYRTGDGWTVLRMTPFGGATYYADGDMKGAGASRVRDAAPLTPAPTNRAALEALGVEAQALLKARHDVDVVFAAEGRNPAALAEAIRISAKAVAIVASDEAGASAVKAGLAAVKIVAGKTSAMRYQGETLTIEIAPAEGAAGRPSARALARYLENTL